MFSTFSTAPESDPAWEQVADHSRQNIARPRRHQVSRACVWCRTFRIKCDATYPCHNCRVKGRTCSDEKGKNGVRTFPLAMKEIDRLKDRVKELEEKLSNVHIHSKIDQQDDEGPAINNLPVPLPINLDPLNQHGGNKKYYNWGVISTRTAKANEQCYGSSSSIYFLAQMTSYLEKALHQPPSSVQVNSASQYIISPVQPDGSEFTQAFMRPDSSTNDLSLSQSQEESLLAIFWKSYCCIYPILDELEFGAYHRSLWDATRSFRQPSALVDIVLAISMQYGATSKLKNLAATDFGDLYPGNAIVTGRWFYLRCQNLLAEELEGPSIMTFQSYFLSVVWLINASFQNMAHSVMATGIRTGIILGLHLEPSEHLPQTQKEFRKRLWWTMYALEMLLGMEFGRPLAVSITQVNCGIPDESSTHTHRAFPINAQLVKLILATRAVYITFYRKCAGVLRRSTQQDLHQDPQGLESCAEFLKITYLQTWLHQLPDSMKCGRRGLGQPFSTDRSPLEVAYTQSIWSLRHSIYLELLYHKLVMDLYRPFIYFSRSLRFGTPITDSHALSCVCHAMTITGILHQVLTESTILTGWHEIFQWQWDAMLSIAGFLLAYPKETMTTIAREALNTAITVFELLSANFSSAVIAADTARDLSVKVDVLIDRRHAPHDRQDAPSSDCLSFFRNMPESKLPEIVDIGLDVVINPTLFPKFPEEEPFIFQNAPTNSSGYPFDFNSLGGLGDVESFGAAAFDFLDFGEAGDF